MLKIIDDENKRNIETRGGAYVALGNHNDVEVGINIDGCDIDEVINICINLHETIDKIVETHPAIRAGYGMYMLDRLTDALEKKEKEDAHEGVKS